MKTLDAHMISYARYHRDPRNIATHFVGIPMIVFAVIVLLSRPYGGGGGVVLSPAWVAVLAASVFYVRLHVGLGAMLSALLVGGAVLAQFLAQGTTLEWLGWGLGLFIVGWVFQFVGHFYEGRKPAFADDVMGLLQGPMFVLVEALFALGQLPALKKAVEDNAGPVRRDPNRQTERDSAPMHAPGG